MDREWTAVGDRRANKARKSLGKNPAVSVCYLISDALDHNCYYETTTAFYTLATTDTFVELAEGIIEHILSSSTSLVRRRYGRPKVGPSIGPRRRTDS